MRVACLAGHGWNRTRTLYPSPGVMMTAETSFGWPTTARRVEESERMICGIARADVMLGERYVERERYYRVKVCHLSFNCKNSFLFLYCYHTTVHIYRIT